MRFTTAVAAALALAAIIGCGTAGTDQEQIRDAYRAYAKAFADGDGTQLCERLTAESRQDLLAVTEHLDGETSCAAVAGKLKTLVEKRELDIVRKAAIATVTITGDRAVVEGPVGIDEYTTRMRKVSGSWLVDLDVNDVEGFGPL